MVACLAVLVLPKQRIFLGNSSFTFLEKNSLSSRDLWLKQLKLHYNYKQMNTKPFFFSEIFPKLSFKLFLLPQIIKLNRENLSKG